MARASIIVVSALALVSVMASADAAPKYQPFLGGVIPVNIKEVPYYPLPQPVIAAYPNATKNCGANNICDGSHFLFNGDIMIPTEVAEPGGIRLDPRHSRLRPVEA